MSFEAVTTCLLHLRPRQGARVEQGVALYDDGKFKQAKAIWLPLAEAGHPKAMNVIGMLHSGTPIFPNNPVTACDWYERAAQAGHASGMYNLSTCFYWGKGRALDIEEAQFWITKAAENGTIGAMLCLAGREETSDEERRHWLKKAANKGSRVVAANLWLDGHREDAPDFSLLDELCITVRIMLLKQGNLACDD